MSSCRSCSAPLVWVETPAKRKMPVDADSWRTGEAARRKVGDVVVTREGQVVTVKSDGLIVEGGTSHFSTCPSADEHRAAKRSTNAQSNARPRAAVTSPTCRDCKASIEWRTTPAGVPVAVDPLPYFTICSDLGAVSKGRRVHSETCSALLARQAERLAASKAKELP